MRSGRSTETLPVPGVQKAGGPPGSERTSKTRMERLAAVSRAFETYEDLAESLTAVCSELVPDLGDLCILHLVADGRGDPEVLTAHTDPSSVVLVRDALDQHLEDPEAIWVAFAAPESGEPLLIADLEGGPPHGGDRPPVIHKLIDAGLSSIVVVPLRKRGRMLGSLALVASAHGGRYTDDDLMAAEIVAARVAASIDNRRLRASSDRTSSVDADLAELGQRLIEASQVDDVVEVALHTAPILEADEVSVALMVDEEHVEVRRVIGAPEGPLVPIFAPVVGNLTLEAAVRSGAREFAENAGPASRSVVLSPLLDDERCTVAVLIFEWNQTRSFDAVDRNAIETLSRLCGQALRRAQIGEESEQVARVARSLAVARRTSDVAGMLVEHAASELGTVTASLRIHDPAIDALVSVGSRVEHPWVADRYERLAVDSDAPAPEVFRSEVPLWVGDLRVGSPRFTAVTGGIEASGVLGLAAVPLRSSDGVVVGVATFGWPGPMRFGRRLEARLETLCELAGQTLERVRLQESEHLVVAALQRQLLPKLTDHPGLQIAAHYQPASGAVGMGGDWFQAFLLDDASTVAIVGDVVGHGVEAIASMARLQNLVTALVRSGTPLDELLASLDAVLAEPGGAFATAVLLHVDPSRDRLGCLLAGHPPPIVRDAAGTARLIDAPRRPLLGLGPDLARIGEPASGPGLRYFDLAPGALVLAYTDGLIERRGEVIDAGLLRLAELVADMDDADLPAALTRLVSDVRTAETPWAATVDDVAVLALRRT